MIQRKTFLLIVLVILLTKQTYQWPVDPEINFGTEKNLVFAAIAIKEGNAYEYFCGGLLVHPNNVITTKSCAKKYPEATLYASFENGDKPVKVQRVTVFNESSDDRGISLLKLEEAIVVSGKIQLLRLPESAVVTNIPITSTEECAACFGDVHDLVCAQKSNLPAHIVGNIIHKNEDSQNCTRFVLMGLVTDLKPNCDSKKMVAIIDVSYYLEWIKLNQDSVLLHKLEPHGRRWLPN